MADIVVVEKDMAYNRRDLIAGLHRAFGDVVEPDGQSFKIPVGSGALSVELGVEAVRRIALIEVVHMPVTLTFTGLNETQRAETLKRFDRAFQRGGG
ncbi:MAG: hypothetical protein RIC16_00030 [Rhodospirillales bacterium]